nr:pyridoxal-phosphate dependent enzyme [Planomonospora sp. ID67723]
MTAARGRGFQADGKGGHPPPGARRPGHRRRGGLDPRARARRRRRIDRRPRPGPEGRARRGPGLGTVTGVGWFLREKKPDVQVVAVEPAESPVLSGGAPGPHGIQGLGAGFVPEVLDTGVYGEMLLVDVDTARDTARDAARRLARAEGILTGVSGGADARRLIPAQRHAQIFATFAELPAGMAFVLVNDHDPKPLYYQFAAERPGEFTWDYVDSGPAVWRVRVGRP